ncbi:MAG: hypothetical protein CMH57_05685 [Myxococcales bacterium]|nr:hypothetical protein [Myxococcales bacterium]
MSSRTTSSRCSSPWAGEPAALGRLIAASCALWVASGCLEGSGRGVGDVGATSAVDAGRGDDALDPRTGCPLNPAPGPDEGPRAYMTLASSDQVAVFDLSDPTSPRALRCAPIDPNPDWSDEPFDLAADPRGWVVTVPHGFGFLLGELWSFEPGAVDSPRTLELVGEPDHVALSPDGDTVYVTALQNIERPLGPYTEPGQFMVVDRATWAVEAQYPLGLGAAGLDVAPDGSRVVITSAGTDELYVYTPSSGDFRGVPVGPSPTSGSPTYQPFYVALADGGALAWVSALKSDDARLIDLERGELLAAVDLGEGAAPRDIVWLERQGLVAVAATGRDEVVLIDAATRAVQARVPVGPPAVTGGAPYGLAAVPGSSWLLVANSANPDTAATLGALVVIDVERGEVVTERPVGFGPRMIAVVP